MKAQYYFSRDLEAFMKVLRHESIKEQVYAEVRRGLSWQENRILQRIESEHNQLTTQKEAA